MKRKVVIIGIVLIVAHVLTEAHSILLAAWPEIGNISEVDLFLAPAFKMDLHYLWYIKMTGDALLNIITFAILAYVAREYSYTLFLIGAVFTLYHVVDLYLFWWIYKRTVWVYWALIIASVIAVLFLIFPMKAKGIYKSMI